MKAEESNKKTLKDSLKSEDTEEVIDIYFYRPIGFFFAKIAMKLHITPNMITIASIFIGSFAGLLFYPNNLEINIIGMLLLVLANSFDSADGQLARLTNNSTRIGRFLDGLAGDVWFVLIYIALALRLTSNGFSNWIWLLASLAGLSHIFHASMADYYRNIHLFFIKGKNGSEHDTSENLTKNLKQLHFSKDFFQFIYLFLYRNYTSQQEMLSPKLQKFLHVLKSKYPNDIPLTLSNELRQENKKYMKYTNILQFNTRVLFLFLCLFINLPWLYFVFDLIVMNSILIYLIYKEEKLAKHFTKKLTE
jgi:hypothetical protein